MRRLAGQVSALDGFDLRAQAKVDAVHDALADNDSAALHAPLAAANPHLSKDHPHIADRISEIGTRTDAARRESRHRNSDRSHTGDAGEE